MHTEPVITGLRKYDWNDQYVEYNNDEFNSSEDSD
jgi:hypothetical protein